MHIPIHTVDKKICIRFLKIFFLKKYFFIYISWISITIDSAVIVPYAAPDAPHFGIKIKLIVVFITAPIHTAIKEIFSFLNADNPHPIKLAVDIEKIMGVIMCIG